jgi:hypothetical protein
MKIRKVMKNKEFDIERSGYYEKVESIKKRKINLKMLQDPEMIKRIKKDLAKEKRTAKHSEKNKLKEWIKEEINNYKK